MNNDINFFIEQFRKESLIPLIAHTTAIKNKRILDFGCGTGYSTFALAIEGGICEGVDISKERVLTARKTKDEYYSNLQVNFNYSLNTTSLPYGDSSFDMVVCNAVFEHILPDQRENHFKEIYRLVKPGGEIIIRGTPNRFFPKDGHTSGLWFVPWLPLSLAKHYVIFRNGAIKKSDIIAKKNLSINQKLKIIPNDEWFERGIKGLAYKDLNFWIKSNELKLKLLNSNMKTEITKYANNSPTWGKNKVFIFIIIGIGKILDLLSISYHNFSPYLNLIFRREE